nr:MAG TPA: hypothetical protein [Caudoviricetes sp.]
MRNCSKSIAAVKYHFAVPQQRIAAIVQIHQFAAQRRDFRQQIFNDCRLFNRNHAAQHNRVFRPIVIPPTKKRQAVKCRAAVPFLIADTFQNINFAQLQIAKQLANHIRRTFVLMLANVIANQIAFGAFGFGKAPTFGIGDAVFPRQIRQKRRLCGFGIVIVDDDTAIPLRDFVRAHLRQRVHQVNPFNINTPLLQDK